MRNVYAAASRLFGCLALALLALNLLAAPTQLAFADSGGGPNATAPPACPNSSGCNNGCITAACYQAGCANVLGCTCSNDSYDPNCSKRCACTAAPGGGTSCECGPK
jgi:hypothetical protein